MEYTLKHPLAGFENIQTMKLTQLDDYFYKLESKKDKISFTLVDPFKLRDYEFELPTCYKVLLDAKDESRLLTLNIMIMSNPAENSTINFIAPLIFNTENNYVVQCLLDNIKYPQFGLAQRIGEFF